MRTAVVMQPYFFPYLGYFQLVAASSVFVYFQDASYIKGGWINRNRVLVQGRPHVFTVPIEKASSHRTIEATNIANAQDWRSHFVRLLEQAYARAPFRDRVLNLVSNVVYSTTSSIGRLAEESVRAVCAYVGFVPQWRQSHEFQFSDSPRGAARIKRICQALEAERYVNAPGGKALYDAQDFQRAGIELRFLRPVLPEYEQTGGAFVSGLSIIDVLMFNSPEVTRTWMEAYELE